MKIVVLCGGVSPERNVSISSGTKVAKALQSLGHKVVLVDMFFGLEDYDGSVDKIFDNPPPLGDTKIDETAPDLEEVRNRRKLKSRSMFGQGVLEVCSMADVVFLGLHGTCGEDGKVQAVFDLMGIPYTGSGHLGSAIAMNKDLTKRLVAPHGVLTPPWRLVDSEQEDMEAIALETGLPCVVKPVDSGSSIGVSIVHNRQELTIALKTAASQSRYVVLEKYIKGREIQVGILDDKALPSIEIIAEGFYDYRNKYQPGVAVEICPARIPAETEKRLGDTALKVHRLLGLSAYSRADFILDEKGDIYFLEINTLPGMTPTSLVPQEAEAVGIDYPTLCQTIIDIALRERGHNS
ncbi:MAG TPA: D-alanine--D-alanine ligase [Clostridiales bacterium]|nr:D-alanine--D-alanine ligase [Clostridiales bacterium]